MELCLYTNIAVMNVEMCLKGLSAFPKQTISLSAPYVRARIPLRKSLRLLRLADRSVETRAQPAVIVARAEVLAEQDSAKTVRATVLPWK
jgi:hypothetical protein